MTRVIDLSDYDGEPNTGRQVHDDERRLLARCQEVVERTGSRTVRVVHVGQQVGVHPQRARELARTWSNLGWYRYGGTSPDCGQLTDEGLEADP